MCNFLCIAVLQYTWLCCIVNQHVVQKYLCFLPYFLGWAQWTIPVYERANCYAKCPGCYLKIIICYTLIAFSAYKRSSVYIFCYAKIASWNRSLWLIKQGWGWGFSMMVLDLSMIPNCFSNLRNIISNIKLIFLWHYGLGKYFMRTAMDLFSLLFF